MIASWEVRRRVNLCMLVVLSLVMCESRGAGARPARPVVQGAAWRRARAPDGWVRRARRAVEDWRFAEAGALVTGLAGLYPQDARVVRAVVRWFYLQGRYPEARAWLGRLSARERVRDKVIVHTAAALARVAGYAVRVSPSGHFVFRVPPGPDALLVGYGTRTLEQARARLARDWGLAPDEPVRVEILPGPDALAEVSALTEDEVRRTGTIALASDHKIWLVTPRALVTGYAWQDTLNHELIHYLLETHARHRVPLWLHEGLARYGQERWRKDFPTTLTPMEEHLLAEARAAHGLIPLARMSPSFAKLRDGREAALAFAQVDSMVLFLVRGRGQQGLRTLIARLASGQSVDAALQAAAGETLRGFVASWRRALGQRTLRRLKGVRFSGPRYRSPTVASGSAAGKPGGAPGGVGRPDRAVPAGAVARHRRLGALLRSRGRVRAAVREYRRSFRASGGAAGQVGNTLGRLLLRLGRARGALRVARAALRVHPEMASLHVVVARAATRLGLRLQAVRALFRANAIDPFDPEVHCRLAALGGQEVRRDRERKACLALGGEVTGNPSAVRRKSALARGTMTVRPR